MKRMFLFILIMGSAMFAFAQTATLDIALSSVSSYIESQLPQGSRVLIIDPASPSQELGAYVAQELSTRLVNGRRIVVTERSANVMQSIMAESDYQLSGEVSNASIQGIGNQSGAQFIITGIINGSADRYRFNMKITSVRTAEIAGQYGVFFQTDPVLNSLLASSRPVKTEPEWITRPVTARTTYETGGSLTGVSQWYYGVGISNKTTSRQTSRTRARQNISQAIAEIIASDIKARTDITSLSMFQSSGIEETETRIEAALTNSIRTRVPAYEELEWYDVTGNLDGREYHMSYVLVRFPRQDILSMVEKIEPDRIADTIIMQMNINVNTDDRTEIIRQLTESRNRALEIINTGLGGR